MAYSLDIGDKVESVIWQNDKETWPRHFVIADRQGEITFHFKDHADFCQQYKDNPLVREFFKGVCSNDI
jgi:hypothetical protein